MADLDGISGSIDPKLQLGMINNNFQRIRNESRTKIYKDKTQQIVMLLGKLAATGTHGMITYNNGVPSTLIDESGIKVAQSGVDVTTATDDQLVMSSNFNMLKIVDSGTISVTRPAGIQVGSGSYNHGLGYTPVVIAYYVGAGVNHYPIPHYIVNGNNGTIDQEIYMFVDNNDVNFDILTNNSSAVTGTAFTANIKYFIMVETAS